MAEDTHEATKPAVPAVARAALLLDLVSAEPDALGLSDLAERLALAKSSVHALTRTLIDERLLLRTSRQTFIVGPRLMRWATAFSERSDVATEFARIWDESTVRLQGATITLSMRDGNDVVFYTTVLVVLAVVAAAATARSPTRRCSWCVLPRDAACPAMRKW